jgi:tRNA pseudouridine55 synthase
MDLPKEYIGQIKLGQRTDTDDITGKIIKTDSVPEIDRQALAKTCHQFTGQISQIPPMFSAKKIGGKRLYKIARKGEVVERPPKAVTIYSLDVISFDSPFIDIRVKCSKGTYIRSLARDIGDELGCGALLHSLVRTKIGDYKIEESLTVEKFKEILT